MQLDQDQRDIEIPRRWTRARHTWHGTVLEPGPLDHVALLCSTRSKCGYWLARPPRYSLLRAHGRRGTAIAQPGADRW